MPLVVCRGAGFDQNPMMEEDQGCTQHNTKPLVRDAFQVMMKAAQKPGAFEKRWVAENPWVVADLTQDAAFQLMGSVGNSAHSRTASGKCPSCGTLLNVESLSDSDEESSQSGEPFTDDEVDMLHVSDLSDEEDYGAELMSERYNVDELSQTMFVKLQEQLRSNCSPNWFEVEKERWQINAAETTPLPGPRPMTPAKEIHVHFDDVGIAGFVFFYEDGSHKRSEQLLKISNQQRILRMERGEIITKLRILGNNGHQMIGGAVAPTSKLIFYTSFGREWYAGLIGVLKKCPIEASGETSGHGLHDISFFRRRFGGACFTNCTRDAVTVTNAAPCSLYFLALEALPDYLMQSQGGSIEKQSKQLISELFLEYSRDKISHIAQAKRCMRVLPEFQLVNAYKRKIQLYTRKLGQVQSSFAQKKRHIMRVLEDKIGQSKEADNERRIQRFNAWAHQSRDTLQGVEKMRCDLVAQFLEPGMGVCVVPNCGRVFELEHRNAYKCSVTSCPSNEMVTCGCTISTCRGCSMETCYLHSASHFAWCAQTLPRRCGYYVDMDVLAVLNPSSPIRPFSALNSYRCGKIVPTTQEKHKADCCRIVCCSSCRRCCWNCSQILCGQSCLDAHVCRDIDTSDIELSSNDGQQH